MARTPLPEVGDSRGMRIRRTTTARSWKGVHMHENNDQTMELEVRERTGFGPFLTMEDKPKPRTPRQLPLQCHVVRDHQFEGASQVSSVRGL